MSPAGTVPTETADVDPRYVEARRVLLNALAALAPHGPAFVVAGAQAVYLRTGDADIAVAQYTTDGDLARVSVEARLNSKRKPVALCLEVHDLVLAKCAAGRARDWEFAEEALRSGLVESKELLERIDDMPVAEPQQGHIRDMLSGIAEKVSA